MLGVWFVGLLLRVREDESAVFVDERLIVGEMVSFIEFVSTISPILWLMKISVIIPARRLS